MIPNLAELIDPRTHDGNRLAYCGMTMLPVAFEGEWMKYHEVLHRAVVKELWKLLGNLLRQYEPHETLSREMTTARATRGQRPELTDLASVRPGRVPHLQPENEGWRLLCQLLLPPSIVHPRILCPPPTFMPGILPTAGRGYWPRYA